MSIFTQLTAKAARQCAAVLLGLSILTGAAQAQVVAPQRAAPAQINAPADATSANAKLFDRTCVCDVSCNGANRSTTFQGPNGPIVTTPMRQQCADKCNEWVEQNKSRWASELGKQACNSMQCAGSSKLSTGDSIGVGPSNLDTSGFPACASEPKACCPGYLANANLLQMSKHESAAGGNVTETILTGSPQFSELIAAIQAQLNLLKHSACAAGQNLSVRLTFTHWNTNSITAPTAPNTAGWTAAGQFTVNIPAAGLAGLAGPGTGTWIGPNSTAFSIPVNPNYYVIMASAVVVGSRGQELKCGDFDGTCFNKLRFRDVYNPAANFKSANPGAAASNRQAF